MIERWIVVGGCPRSGTTLVGNALGDVEGAIVTPEAQFASEACAALKRGVLAPSKDDIIDFITHHWRYQIWKDPAPDNWPDFEDCQDGFAVCGRVVSHIVTEHARHRGRPNARIWIDHTPEHLRVLNRLDKMGPRLSAIHLIRDGRGVAASMQKVDWGPRDIVTLAHWWQARLAEGFAAQLHLGASATHVYYEDIIRDPAATFNTLCSKLGVDFSPSMLTSQALKVIDYTRGQHQAVGLRPDPSRATAWKATLAKRDQEIFEAIAGDTLSLLGYDAGFDAPRPQTRSEKIASWLRYNPVRRKWVKLARKKRRAGFVVET